MKTMTYLQKNKKRFSDEQIKSLEITFLADSRPESKAKQQLAGELGLQPRQVAVWFQNRRARSRTKQIEREYNALKASYDNLVSSVESLKEENQELNNQLHELKTQLGKHRGSGNLESGQTENAEETKDPGKDPGSHLSGGCDEVEKDAEVLDLAQSRDSSLTSSVDWCSFNSSCYRDESSCSQWWEFWS